MRDDEVAELLHTVVSGGDDPALDLAIVWTHLECGIRREGLLGLRVCDVDRVAQALSVFEKGGVYRTVPASAGLVDYLLRIAVERGGAALGPLDPALYYRARANDAAPRRLTGRRYDTLHRRIQRTLPWAARSGFCAHALRWTAGQAIERIAGTQVARLYLGHAERTVTDTYTRAGQEEVASAVAIYTGRPHPLSGGS